jgi:FKBP-type peptidyl-prolyl cis-trans isomerase FkpA
MRRFALIGPVALAISMLGCHGGGLGGGSAEPKTEEQKTLYAVGLYLAKQVGPFSLKPDEIPYVIQGMRDGIAGTKPAVELTTYGPKLNELARSRAKEKTDEEKKAAAGVLAAAAAESGAEKLPSGLIYKQIKEGTGETPKPSDRVKVHYHGTLRDGKVFDSSVQRGQPAVFGLTGVIPCWTEGLQKMKVGGKAKLTCPSEIAYGERGHPPTIPGGAVLTFEVELIDIEPPAAPGAGMPGRPGMSMPGRPGGMPGDPHGGSLNQPLQMAHPGSASPGHPATPPASK